MTSKTIDSPAQRAVAQSAKTLLRADAVRVCSQRMLALATAGDLQEWSVDLDRLAPTADFVAQIVRERYPRLDVPVHSRWRHFVFGGRDLWQDLVARAHDADRAAMARSAFDLAITSVLLDAGAGARWRYQDRTSGSSAGRSEGLALASLRWFEGGGLSSRPREPYRADAEALRHTDLHALRNAFQVTEHNQILGLEGRAALLNRLGAVVESRPDLFARSDSPRPGGLFDVLRDRSQNGYLPAGTVLETLLEAFGPIWQDRPSLGGVPLGDCWPHPALQGKRPEEGYAPLHKLSQWLTYSLFEPLGSAGITVSNVDELTGLAEYRNGGLFIDMGVVNAREPERLSATFGVADPLVVGWRSLTVALLDLLAPMVRTRLGLSAQQFPLANVLEGGTWAAGRSVAGKMRADGGPPIHVLSDGTVF